MTGLRRNALDDETKLIISGQWLLLKANSFSKETRVSLKISTDLKLDAMIQQEIDKRFCVHCKHFKVKSKNFPCSNCIRSDCITDYFDKDKEEHMMFTL